MKVYNTHADKATIKLHPEDILLDIKGQYMKVSNTHAGNASIKQLQREGRLMSGCWVDGWRVVDR